MQPRIEVATSPGKVVQIGKTRLIPYAQSYRLTISGFPGGLVWNRPVSILTVHPDGSEEVTPVLDITRRSVIGIWAIGILGVFVFWLSTRKLTNMENIR